MISNISFWLVEVISVSRSDAVRRERGPASETESSSDAQDALVRTQERDATFASAFVSSHFFPTTRGATYAKISFDSAQLSRK